MRPCAVGNMRGTMMSTTAGSDLRQHVAEHEHGQRDDEHNRHGGREAPDDVADRGSGQVDPQIALALHRQFRCLFRESRPVTNKAEEGREQ